MLEALKNENARVLMNYHMETAGQIVNVGHHSPVVASHAATDSIMVMDTCNSGGVWVKWDKARAAM